MGFFQSTKNQVGRDLGKVISNAVFGDKHASVYRRAQSKARQEQHEEQIHQNQLNGLNRAVLDNVDKVLGTTVSNDVNDICNTLDLFHSQMLINGWKPIIFGDGTDENRINNKYPDACYYKFKQLLFKLKASNCNQDIYDHYYGIYKTLNRKKTWGKFSRLFLFIFFWIALAIFWIIMSALD
uniref:hypothetical protein n=1 Tax=Prevotella sp. TaxID=59823 RepID=UPI004029ED05